jgi:myo-inositol-1(or 4)-monophosphatase
MPISDTELAVRAAQAGAAVVRSYFGGALTRFQKGPGDFATTADVEAEAAIVGVLRAERPGDAVLGEETGRTGTGEGGRMWMVDPLCGTLNYAVKTMIVAVNVALRDGAAVSVAACADPFTDEVFWTDGRAAYARRGGADELLAPTAESRLVDVNLDPPFPNRDVFLAARMLADDAFTQRFRPRVVSTTLAVTWVAAGRRAAYVTDGHLEGSVHFAAGIALCQAAGCIVTGIDGRPVHTGRGGLIVAADEPTHAALMALVAGQSRICQRSL